jgi:hypothetical protein
MIRYIEFESAVAGVAPQFTGWKHLLPAIPIAHRPRFIHVLKKDFEIPDAFDIIMSSLGLTDDKFEDFLHEAINTRHHIHVGYNGTAGEQN